jgi:branched-chain amino acid transport system substrate-binding protein
MNKNTKIIIGIVVVLIVIGGIWYEASRKSREEVIKIGATLSLSGKYTYIGEAELQGMKMAIEEINQKGGINGKKIELVVEDNKGEASEAVNNVNKFVNIDNVDVVFSVFTHITQAVKSIVFGKNKLFFYVSTVPDIAYENKYTFRDFYDAKTNGEAIAVKTHELGYKKVAFLTEISDQCSQFEEAFSKKANEYGININSKEKYQITETDLKTYLLKLNFKNSEALVACAWRHENILMKQLKELGLIKMPTLHWVAPYLPVADTPEIRSLFEENGAISSWYGFSGTGNKEYQEEFIKKFKSKYGKNPLPDSAYIYDDVYILTNATKKCGGDINNKDCIADEIRKTKYDGVGGYIEFDEGKSAIREVFMIKVKNGEWEIIK